MSNANDVMCLLVTGTPISAIRSKTGLQHSYILSIFRYWKYNIKKNVSEDDRKIIDTYK